MKNTYDKASFVVSNFIWSLSVWLCYKGILFKTIGNHTLTESKFILLIIIDFSILFGFLLQHKNRRNEYSILMNLSIGYGIYTILTYRAFNPKIILCMLVIVLILVFTYGLMLFRRRKHISGNKGTKANIKSFLNGTQAFIACGCIAVMGFYTLRIAFNSSIAYSKISANTKSDESISDNFEALSLLSKENWEYLSLDEKTSILQLVANIECTNLGLPHELNICVMPLEDYECGYYSDDTHSITVSASDIMYNDLWDLINTICHESFHAYEHRLIDAYYTADKKYTQLKIFDIAKVYEKEFSNYIEYNSDENNFYDYYYQSCEEDARNYADLRELEYRKVIYSS